MKWFKAFIPPPKLTISKWAEKYRFLSAESASEAGKYRVDRAVYQKGIMDAFNEKNIDTTANIQNTTFSI